MAYKHRFTGKSAADDIGPRQVIIVKTDAECLSDLIEAFKGYLKACGFDWNPGDSPFADDDGG